MELTGASPTSTLTATVARASSRRGQTTTNCICEWCVGFLAQAGAKHTLWAKLGSTGARGASSMAAMSSCSHGGSAQRRIGKLQDEGKCSPKDGECNGTGGGGREASTATNQIARASVAGGD